METPALAAARRSRLIRAGEPLLVTLSGGSDSVCLLDVARALGARVTALHVNYGLRPEADADARHCTDLCDRLAVPITIERVTLPATGNLHAHAREARYALAERHAEGDYAAAHTASDQAETILYRLASSPGRRALGAMRPRRGRLVRPLLSVTAAETREHCAAAGLAWREDSLNADPRFARARVRHDLLPALERIAPGAERTIALTGRLLAEEEELLEAVVDRTLTGMGGAPSLVELRALGPALARLVLRRIAEPAGPPGWVLGAEQAERVLSFTGPGGSKSLDVGGGVRAVIEYGRVGFRMAGREDAAVPDPVELPVPGAVRFGGWQVEACPGGDGDALDPAALGATVTVRGWRAGDRIRPAGLGGSKKLQDLFTDRKVPRRDRRSIPVVEVDGEIAWVAGLAVGERFRAGEDAAHAISLSASRVIG